MPLTDAEREELEALRAERGAQPTPLAERHRRGTAGRDATTLANTGRSVLQGATMGFGDELLAGARSAFGEDYDTALEDERAQIAAFNRQNPLGSVITEGVGGFALTGPVGAARSLGARFAPGIVRDTAAALGSRFNRLPVPVQTGVIGGGTGAVAGLGQGEGDFSERLPNAAATAPAGFVLGAGVPLAFGAGRGSWGAMKRPPAEKAERDLLRDMGRDDLTVDRLANQLALDRYYGVPSTIATQGKNLTSLAEGVANLPGAGAAASQEAIERLHLGQGQRVSRALHQHTKASDYAKNIDDIEKFYKTQATPDYQRAYAADVNMMDSDVAKLLQRVPKDELDKAFLAAKKVYQSDPLNEGKPMRDFLKFEKDAEGNITNAIFPIDMNTREWHAFIRGLREIKDDLAKKGAAHAGNIKEIYKEADRIGKEKNPLFANAQKKYSDTKSVEEAIAEGRADMFSGMSPEDMLKKIRGLSANELDHYRSGAVRAIDDRLAKMVDGANKARGMVNSEALREKLRAITPDPAEYDMLMRSLQTEARDASARARMTLGSPTASRAEKMKEIKEGDELIPQIIEAAKGPTQFAARWLHAKAQGLGVTRRTGDKLGTMLHTSDPTEQANILQRLRARQAQLAEETERANAGYRVGAAAFGSAAASPTMERRLSAVEE